MADYTTIGQYNFPEVPAGIDPQLRELLSSIKEWAELREGVTGSSERELDRYLTGYSLAELAGVDIDSLVRDGFSAAKTSSGSTSTESLNPPTAFTAAKRVFGVYLAWTDPAEDSLNGIRVKYNTSNDVTTAVSVALVPAGNEHFLHYPTDLEADHYYWIRAEGFSSTSYSEWVGSGVGTGGYLVYGYETIDETVQTLMDALQAMDPPAYSGTTTYYAGMHVTYNERVYRCYNDNGGAGISGIAPDATGGSDYWARDGLIRQGTVDGKDTVGIDAELVIDGTIYNRAIATGTISASKLIISDINAMNLENGPATADADATQGALDAGASLDNAKANGVTFITGGYINTDILNVDYSIIVGAKPPTDADNTQDELNLGAAIDNAKANGYTIIDGGYINTSVLSVDYAIIGGNKPPSDADNTSSNPQDYSWVTGTKPPSDADNTQSRLDAGAAIDSAKANGYTLISGGYINTDLLLVDTAQIANAAISRAKIANAAVGSAQIGSAAIGTAHIQNGTISMLKLESTSAGNALVCKNNDSVSVPGTGGTYTKFKENYVSRYGTLRIKFSISIDTQASQQDTHVRIYRNGAAVGTVRYVGAAGTSTYTEDIGGWSAGDLCQLYGYHDSDYGSSVANYFNIYANYSITEIAIE